MDKYKIIKQIGQGNYGKAFLVRCHTDNNFYVIKTIDTTSFNKEQHENALYEVNVLKSLNHPYIIKYIESFYAKNLFCIVMEYADCGDLNKLIKSQMKLKIPLREEVILNWFVQICFAIKYIHERKILHRDLKLSNVFLCSNGDIKLGDFGIAKVLNSTNDYAKTLVGTPYYLSPELCLKRNYNQKSDVWSLGCVLYEMMFMRHAFEADNVGELVLKILKGECGSMEMYNFSSEIKEIVQSILVTNCDVRPDVNAILSMKVLDKYIRMNLIKRISVNENDKAKDVEIYMRKIPTVKTKRCVDVLKEGTIRAKKETMSINNSESISMTRNNKDYFIPEYSYGKNDKEFIIIVELSGKVKEMKSSVKNIDGNYIFKISGVKERMINQIEMMYNSRKEGKFLIELNIPIKDVPLKGRKCKLVTHENGIYEFVFELVEDVEEQSFDL